MAEEDWIPSMIDLVDYLFGLPESGFLFLSLNGYLKVSLRGYIDLNQLYKAYYFV